MSGKPISTGSALKFGLSVLLAGAVLAPAAGAAATGASVEGQRDANDARTRRVCRSIMQTPSRLTRRVCRTQAEWDASMRDQQDSFLRHNFDQTRQGPKDGPGNGALGTPR
jgi:hypothetical protein